MDRDAQDRIRAIGYCEYCGSRGPVQCAHIKSRGSGGHDTEDNMVALCAECHTGPRSHHSGHIKSEELSAIAVARIARQKVLLDFGTVNCPACFAHVTVRDEGGCLVCANCSAVLLRYGP